MTEDWFTLQPFEGKQDRKKTDSKLLGKCLLPPYFSEIQQKIFDFSVREDDVWLISFPRTGSTWCQEMIWLIQNNLNFQSAQTIIQQLRAPLIESSVVLFEHVDSVKDDSNRDVPRFSRINLPLDLLPPELENAKTQLEKLFTDPVGFVQELPSPRCIKSHLPIELLPDEIFTKKPKIIYTMREPKDLCISDYFHCQTIHKMNMSFETFCDLFMNGDVPIGSVFNHYQGFWSKKDDLDILILHYEEMKANTRETVKKIATFLGKPLSDEDADAVCEFLSFQNMRANKACNLQVLVDNRQGSNFYEKSGKHFIRKGIVGDYKNYMSLEMIEKFDQWISKNTKGTDLIVSYMHLTIGESRGNAVLARAIYAERFPNRMVPERRFFLKVDRSLRERGQLQVNPGIRVRARPIRDNVEEEKLHNIDEEDPNTNRFTYNRSRIIMVIDTMETVENARLDGILRKYFTNKFRKGYVEVDGVTMPARYRDMQEEIFNWSVSEEDVWICSFPKTGTTWAQEMVWMIMNNLDFKGAEVNLGIRSPFLEVSSLFDFRDLMKEIPGFEPPIFLKDSLQFVKNQSSPVCIKTHLPWNLLPKEIQSGDKTPKIIYTCRDPKDTCYSYYHHSKLMEGYTGNFNDFCKLFLAGKLSFAPYWNNVLHYWNHRNDSNVLFLTYEEMKTDLPSVIRKTAKFLEKDLDEEQIQMLKKHLSFESMKNNPAVNYELVREMYKKYKLINYEGEFMRSGSIGGYKAAMGPELLDQFDRWIKTHTKNTDFNFYV
ncbi:uncharacterized protein LOC126741932 [Anthonomus grandis grandis]|uniref:uncharacterized protein LOC126741932 n=1 Tax=Anthonomus grandis grandis TaxID=2921223 RepID=UPI002165758A|nr:uncharacterized protein LOC126741932 [Anthonomus grandis grandis]